MQPKNEYGINGVFDPEGDVQLGELVELQGVDWTWSDERKRETIMNELKTVGFFVVTNVPGHDEQKLLDYGKWLCALTPEEKSRITKKYWNPASPNCYRGFAPYTDNDPSHVEIYDMGMDFDKVTPGEQEYQIHEETPWPTWCEEGIQFTEFMKGQYKLRCAVAKEIL